MQCWCSQLQRCDLSQAWPSIPPLRSEASSYDDRILNQRRFSTTQPCISLWPRYAPCPICVCELQVPWFSVHNPSETLKGSLFQFWPYAVLLIGFSSLRFHELLKVLHHGFASILIRTTSYQCLFHGSWSYPRPHSLLAWAHEVYLTSTFQVHPFVLVTSVYFFKLLLFLS